MESKFIRKIISYVKREAKIVGSVAYYKLPNGNCAKAWCETTGVYMEIINNLDGKIDGCFLPFKEYFQPVQCSAGAPKWTQHIDGNHWYFEKMYKHVLPKDSDYLSLAQGMETYMQLFE